MLGEMDHRDAKHLAQGSDEEHPVRGSTCVVMIAVWLLFLAVVVGWLLSLKGVRLWQ